jgi:hypothetical protein
MAKAVTVAILPGFTEGPWHLALMALELEQAGYKYTALADKADVVITHSAGCYLLPSTQRNVLIILISPPYWPGKPMVLCLMQKILSDFIVNTKRSSIKFWLQKTKHNSLYFWGDLRWNCNIIFKVHRHKFYEALPEKQITIIRNTHDFICTPDIAKKLPKQAKFKLHELPGEHDDCWYDPEPYIKLIDSIIKKQLH